MHGCAHEHGVLANGPRRFASVLLSVCVTRFGEVPDADVGSGHIVLPMRVVGDVPGCYDAPNLACQLVDASSASYSATRIACTVPAGVGQGFQVCVGCGHRLSVSVTLLSVLHLP